MCRVDLGMRCGVLLALGVLGCVGPAAGVVVGRRIRGVGSLADRAYCSEWFRIWASYVVLSEGVEWVI